MLLVIDANIIFSALISPQGITSELLFSSKLTLISPEFLEKEIEKYISFMAIKSGRTREDLERMRDLLLSRLKILPAAEYETYRKKAEQISPDQKDSEYFAAALAGNCSLWSNDKRLKKQSEVKVFSTSELVSFFSLQN